MILAEFIEVIFHIGIWVYKSREFVGRSNIFFQSSGHSWKVKIPWQDTQALLWALAESLPRCFNSIIWPNNRYYLKCNSTWRSINSDGKQKGAELSLQHNTCKFLSGAHRKHKILGTLAHTFTRLPWVFVQILPESPLTAQAQTQAKVLAQSESYWRRKPDHTLSFSRLLFTFTFGVDPYRIASPSYHLTYPPVTGRLSGRRLFQQSSKP